MLIQFNFRNFKSFKEENTLDMSATSIKEHKEHLIETEKNEKFLKIAAIYGANASGKSNVIEAFKYMRYIIFNSFSRANDDKNIITKKFKFSEKEKNGSSLFEVYFRINKTEYQYGFELDENKIIEEWLYETKNESKKERLIFSKYDSKIELCEELTKYEPLLINVNEKTLFLSFLPNLKIEIINDVYNWFKETQVLNYGDSMEEVIRGKSLPIDHIKDIKKYERLKKFLTNIDIGIENIEVEEIKRENKNEMMYKVFSVHTNIDTKEKEILPLQEESNGTLKMLAIYKNLVEVLDNGRTLFIDELDAKFHPLLIKYIIKLFTSEETNTNNAQLIFTSHDVINLSKEIFRRDEIWFVDKNKKDSSSTLYSLAEFKLENGGKVRNDASYGKDYLYGIYDAVPMLKEYSFRFIGDEK